MKGIKRTVFLFIAALGIIVCASSCGSVATAALRTYEVYDQATTTNGTYIGSASSYSEAQSLARSKGYSRFDWYSTTGDVFGYN